MIVKNKDISFKRPTSRLSNDLMNKIMQRSTDDVINNKTL